MGTTQIRYLMLSFHRMSLTPLLMLSVGSTSEAAAHLSESGESMLPLAWHGVVGSCQNREPKGLCFNTYVEIGDEYLELPKVENLDCETYPVHPCLQLI